MAESSQGTSILRLFHMGLPPVFPPTPNDVANLPPHMKNAAMRGLVASCLGLLALTACRRDPAGPRWDVDLVGPLVHTTFTIGDIVADSLLQVDADGDITLVYRSELFALKLDTVLQAPDTNFAYPFVMPVSGNLPAGFTFPTTNDIARFDLDDLELRFLRIRSGMLNVRIRNQVPGVVLGTYALPGAIDPQGNALSQDCVVPAASGSTTAVYSTSTDLSGYRFDLRGPGYDDVNTLATELGYQLDPNGPANVPVDQGDSLTAVVGYNDIVPAYAQGYFGNRLIDIVSTGSALDLFRNITAGSLDLDAVSADLVVTNSIGVDVQVELDHLRALNSRTGTTVDLVHPIVQGPINLNRAVDLGNAPQASVLTRHLDQDNSNIDALLETLPDSILYAGHVRVNPLGDVSNGNDFLYYESRLQAELELRVPLRLIATGLVLQQVATPDLPGTAEGHAIQGGTLHLFATNGFPFSAGFVLEVIDVNDQVTATIPVNGTIASGVLGTNGLVSTAVSSRIDVPVAAAALDRLYAGDRLRISTVFNTADQTQHVQLLDRYRLELQLTVDLNYVVNGDE